MGLDARWRQNQFIHLLVRHTDEDRTPAPDRRRESLIGGDLDQAALLKRKIEFERPATYRYVVRDYFVGHICMHGRHDPKCYSKRGERRLRPAYSPSPLQDPLHRRLQPLRYLRNSSNCYRLERRCRVGFAPTERPAFARHTEISGLALETNGA